MKQQILALGKDAIIYGVGSILTRFIGLLTLPLFARYLTPEEYGVLAMLAILSMIAQPVFSLGLGAAMGPNYFSESTQEGKRSVIWTVFVINLLSVGLLVLLGWGVPEVLCKAIRLSPEHSELVSLSLLGCGFTILATAPTQKIQFEKQARLYVVITILSAATAIAWSWVTVIHWGWGARGMIWGQIAGGVVVLALFFAVGLGAKKSRFDIELSKKLLRLGAPLIPSFAFLFIIGHANKYVLEWSGGLHLVGIYSMGYNFGAAISIITNGLMTAWYPFFMAYIDRQHEAEVLFGKIFTYYCVGVGIIVVAFFVLANPVVSLLLPKEYRAAAGVVGLIAAGNYLVGIFNLLLPAAHFKRDFLSITLSQFYAAFLSLPLSFAMIHFWGLWGAGLSFMVGHALMALMLRLSHLKYRPDGLSVVYEKRRLMIFGALSVTCVLLYRAGEVWQAGAFAIGQEFVFGVIFMLVFASLVYRCVLDAKERQLILRQLRFLLRAKHDRS